MQKIKIHVLHGDEYDINWIDNAELSSEEEADVIFYTGGTDVNSSLYGQKKGKYTGNPDVERDTYEKEVFDKWVGKKAFVGVCRGSQLLCVLSGGTLIQHMNHPGSHRIMALGKNYMVNSTHHQMMYPFNVEHNLIAFAQESEYHLDENDKQIDMPVLSFKAIEPEVVWFPKTQALCIQSHPEYANFPEETKIWLNEIFNKYVNKREDAPIGDLPNGNQDVLSEQKQLA